MGCTHNCESCGENCSSRQNSNDFKVPENKLSHIKKVIGIVSGKGGVGKSLVTSLLASEMARRGYHTAIMDADMTGPSIPKSFGLQEKAESNDLGIFPVVSKTGIEIMSVNLLLENITDPVVWRGPVIAGVVKQFWEDVIWNYVDYMFVDMPPGTGDVPLTVFQSLPVDGIIIVTSPQDLVELIVNKAVKMANMMNIPILGIVENMSSFKCPDCGKVHNIFGISHVKETAKKFGVDITAEIPINMELARKCDNGEIEYYGGAELDPIADLLSRNLPLEGEE